jgi:fucose permease
MNKNDARLTTLLPVLFGFYVMGFCDVVGIATSFVKEDFNLSETLAGFVPSMVFLWFLLLSMPVSLLMNKIGRKNTVLLSNFVTLLGMLVPFFLYTFASCMVAFALLGIGNTILQVSLNPLLANVADSGKLTSSLTTGQVIKAVSSFMGPLIAAFSVSFFGNWHYIFPIFAAITLLSTVWLLTTNIPREESARGGVSFGEAFGLLKQGAILLCFVGIIFTVGLDVGMNTLTPKLLMERSVLDTTTAGLGSSVYFLCRTAGALIGAFLLAHVSDVKYFRINIIVMLASVMALLVAQHQTLILVLVGIFAFSLSCVFPIIYSFALRERPDKGNEISGLLITGVFGGALIPPLMGWFTDMVGSQAGSLFVLLGGALFLMFCAVILGRVSKVITN